MHYPGRVCLAAPLAERFGYVERSVKRKLKLIRDIWEGEVQS
jgi:hypothetical protein